VEDVVIHEDPAIGAEPIAYMDSMDVRPSIWSLLGGRFVVTPSGSKARTSISPSRTPATGIFCRS